MHAGRCGPAFVNCLAVAVALLLLLLLLRGSCQIEESGVWGSLVKSLQKYSKQTNIDTDLFCILSTVSDFSARRTHVHHPSR